MDRSQKKKKNGKMSYMGWLISGKKVKKLHSLLQLGQKTQLGIGQFFHSLFYAFISVKWTSVLGAT